MYTLYMYMYCTFRCDIGQVYMYMYNLLLVLNEGIIMSSRRLSLMNYDASKLVHSWGCGSKPLFSTGDSIGCEWLQVKKPWKLGGAGWENNYIYNVCGNFNKYTGICTCISEILNCIIHVHVNV